MPTAENFDFATSRLHLLRVSPAALYDNWFLAETEAELALTAWREAGSGVKARAHAAYSAALDREARAAELLATRLRTARG